jgi:hypothetical protein
MVLNEVVPFGFLKDELRGIAVADRPEAQLKPKKKA